MRFQPTAKRLRGSTAVASESDHAGPTPGAQGCPQDKSSSQKLTFCTYELVQWEHEEAGLIGDGLYAAEADFRLSGYFCDSGGLHVYGQCMEVFYQLLLGFQSGNFSGADQDSSGNQSFTERTAIFVSVHAIHDHVGCNDASDFQTADQRSGQPRGDQRLGPVLRNHSAGHLFSGAASDSTGHCHQVLMLVNPKSLLVEHNRRLLPAAY